MNYTLETPRCDSIRKENGKWIRSRVGLRAVFKTFDEAFDVLQEMKMQGEIISDIEIELA